MTSKVNDHRIFRLDTLEFLQCFGRICGRCHRLSCQERQGIQNVGLGGFLIEQRDDLDARKAPKLGLLLMQLLAKDLSIGYSVFEVVLWVGVLIDANGQYVSPASPLEVFSAGDGQRSVCAFDVIAIEGIGS